EPDNGLFVRTASDTVGETVIAPTAARPRPGTIVLAPDGPTKAHPEGTGTQKPSGPSGQQSVRPAILPPDYLFAQAPTDPPAFRGPLPSAVPLPGAAAGPVPGPRPAPVVAAARPSSPPAGKARPLAQAGYPLIDAVFAVEEVVPAVGPIIPPAPRSPGSPR